MTTRATQGPPNKVEAPARGSNPGPQEEPASGEYFAAVAPTDASPPTPSQHIVAALQAQFALIGWRLLAVNGDGFVAARHGLTCALSTIEASEHFLALVLPNALADAADDQLDLLRGDCLAEPKERTCSAQ